MIPWKKAKKVWFTYAKNYWWGDPLDVRFYLCKELNTLKNKKILDIGCNVGIILNCADNSNLKEGFDLDAESINIAKKLNKITNSNAKFYVKDAFKANLKKNSFDVLILSNVLPSYDFAGYSKKDCIDFLSKSTSYLKKGGILYLTSPNGANDYYTKRSKIKITELKKLLSKDYHVTIKTWNPINIHFGHALKFIPGWFKVLEKLMKEEILQKKGLAFYVKAIKK